MSPLFAFHIAGYALSRPAAQGETHKFLGIYGALC